MAQELCGSLSQAVTYHQGQWLNRKHSEAVNYGVFDSKPVSTEKPNTCLESNKPTHTRAGIRVLMRVSYHLSKTSHPPLFSKPIYFSPFTGEMQSH